jgi:hypothetical protein
MPHVAVLHNVSRDSYLGLNNVFVNGQKTEAIEDQDRHPLVLVFRYDTAAQDDMAICEQAFEALNVGEDELAQQYRARRLRSLSSGDVLVIDGQAYSCESLGWRARSDDELRVIAGEAADREIRTRFQFGPDDELSVSVPLADDT